MLARVTSRSMSVSAISSGASGNRSASRCKPGRSAAQHALRWSRDESRRGARLACRGLAHVPAPSGRRRRPVLGLWPATTCISASWAHARATAAPGRVVGRLRTAAEAAIVRRAASPSSQSIRPSTRLAQRRTRGRPQAASAVQRPGLTARSRGYARAASSKRRSALLRSSRSATTPRAGCALPVRSRPPRGPTRRRPRARRPARRRRRQRRRRGGRAPFPESVRGRPSGADLGGGSGRGPRRRPAGRADERTRPGGPGWFGSQRTKPVASTLSSASSGARSRPPGRPPAAANAG